MEEAAYVTSVTRSSLFCEKKKMCAQHFGTSSSALHATKNLSRQPDLKIANPADLMLKNLKSVAFVLRVSAKTAACEVCILYVNILFVCLFSSSC
jgi:hypothetical protein